MSLAELVTVTPPGQVSEISAIVADNMNIGAISTDQLGDLAGSVTNVIVILLDQNIVLRLGVQRPAVLRVHIAPRLTFNHQFYTGLSQVEYHQSPGRIYGLAIT